MPKTTEEIVLERLDQLVRILALQVSPDGSITERARLLKLAGLDNAAIADVLNVSADSVRTLTANLRTKTTRPRRGKTKKGR